MRRITEEDIIKLNEAYLLCGTYSGAAKAVGCSPSTAKKYIIKGYTSNTRVDKNTYDWPSLEEAAWKLQTIQHAASLTVDEAEVMVDLWGELLI